MKNVAGYRQTEGIWQTICSSQQVKTDDRGTAHDLQSRSCPASPNNDGNEAERTIHELQEVLNQLQEKKACGEDDIPPEALKQLSDTNQRILLDILK